MSESLNWPYNVSDKIVIKIFLKQMNPYQLIMYTVCKFFYECIWFECDKKNGNEKLSIQMHWGILKRSDFSKGQNDNNVEK